MTERLRFGGAALLSKSRIEVPLAHQSATAEENPGVVGRSISHQKPTFWAVAQIARERSLRSSNAEERIWTALCTESKIWST